MIHTSCYRVVQERFISFDRTKFGKFIFLIEMIIFKNLLSFTFNALKNIMLSECDFQVTLCYLPKVQLGEIFKLFIMLLLSVFWIKKSLILSKLLNAVISPTERFFHG